MAPAVMSEPGVSSGLVGHVASEEAFTCWPRSASCENWQVASPVHDSKGGGTPVGVVPGPHQTTVAFFNSSEAK